LKTSLKFSIIICFIVCIFACSENAKVHEGIFRGIYEGSNQVQEMKGDDPVPSPREEPPTYEQYERERQEMLTDHKNNQLKQ